LLEGQLVRQIVRFVEKCEGASKRDSVGGDSPIPVQVAAGRS
jgi:hypothetical protein